MGDAIVGIVANPMSGRDIRRLVASASVFPTAEKANMIRRMLTAFGVVGVAKVLMSTDLAGISANVLRAIGTRTATDRRRVGDHAWPEVEFIDPADIGTSLTQTAGDTTQAVTRMVAAGARTIVCLGGDGTARVAAAACSDVPLLALSTGTNNAFPQVREATVAGLAAGLVAVGAVPESTAVRRSQTLIVRHHTGTENALVDVCVSTDTYVGARAIWEPAALRELYCVFGEPDGIGLSSIAGLVSPSPRDEPAGRAIEFAPLTRATQSVYAPIAPGLVAPVGIRSVRRLGLGETVTVRATAGVIAVDGEREFEFGPDHPPPTVQLRPDGPRCVDVSATLAAAAEMGLLTTTATNSGALGDTTPEGVIP